MEDVCKELDEVLMEVMSSLQELSSLRTRYSSAVSEGYFYMSQSRHAMGGPSSVSSLQYDGRMSALVHTSPSIEAETYAELTKLISTKGEPCVEFHVDRIDQSKPGKEDSKTETKMSEVSQLRRRNKEKGSVEEVPLPSSDQKDKEDQPAFKEEFQTGVKDPLKWFGVLVPQYLRRSQSHFNQAVLLSADLAGVQLRLETLRRKFLELLQKKSKLKQDECNEPTEQSSGESFR